MAFEKWYKFYLMQFNNKVYKAPNDVIFIKAGITHHMDVMKRFDPSVDDGYQKNYEDWEIICKFSRVFKSLAEAKAYENYFLTKLYPYDYNGTKVWLEKVLNIEDRNRYDTMSGRSEIRMIPIAEAKKLYQTLNSEKKGVQHDQNEFV